MKEKEYNIYFAIGDFNNDGHGRSIDFHLVSNYSAQEITNFLNEFEKKTGIDICEECKEYQENRFNRFSKETTGKLVNLGIIDSKYVNNDGFYYVEDAFDFVDTVTNCLKYVANDFEWHYRDLKEDTLNKLHGSGYGLFGA